MYREDDAEGSYHHAVCPDFLAVEPRAKFLYAKSHGYNQEECYKSLQRMVLEIAFGQICAGNSLPQPSSYEDIATAMPEIIKKHASNQGQWVEKAQVSLMPVDFPEGKISLEKITLPVLVAGKLVFNALEYARSLEAARNPSAWPEPKEYSIDNVLKGIFHNEIIAYLKDLVESDNGSLAQNIGKSLHADI